MAPSTMTSKNVYFSGINGSDGSYFADAMDVSQIADRAHGKLPGREHSGELDAKARQPTPFPLRSDADPDDLAQAGWAVVFPSVQEPSAAATRQREIREALAPLLEHRQAQAGRVHGRYYREYLGEHAYRSGETKQKYLARLGAGPGPADPAKVPYYLLLVASPEEIPYRVQYQLDVQYAVGRIHFETIEEYGYYARSVVAAETGTLESPRDVAFFATRNPDDTASQLIAGCLTRPLASYVEDLESGWRVHEYIGDPATKDTLGALLGGGRTPSLLFSGGHGVVFDADDERVLRHQGALVCQDWTGPKNNNFSRDVYFSSEDIARDADLSGLIAFHYACYSAGSPRYDDFVYRAVDKKAHRREVAPRALVASLPQRMLAHPRGGALAVVGHVERVWISSFLWRHPEQANKASPQLAVFETAFRNLMDGHRVGYAMESFNLRYAEMASDLTAIIQDIQLEDAEYDDSELAQMWLNSNDARNYTVIGDPAVRTGGPGPR